MRNEVSRVQGEPCSTDQEPATELKIPEDQFHLRESSRSEFGFILSNRLREHATAQSVGLVEHLCRSQTFGNLHIPIKLLDDVLSGWIRSKHLLDNEETTFRFDGFNNLVDESLACLRP